MGSLATSPFAELLDAVPAVVDALPEESLRDVAATSWGALVALLRHVPRFSVPVHPHSALLPGIARRSEQLARAAGSLRFTAETALAGEKSEPASVDVAAGDAGALLRVFAAARNTSLPCGGCGEETCCGTALQLAAVRSVLAGKEAIRLRCVDTTRSMRCASQLLAALARHPMVDQLRELRVRCDHDTPLALLHELAPATGLRVLHLRVDDMGDWPGDDEKDRHAAADRIADAVGSLPALTELRIEVHYCPLPSSVFAALFDHVARNKTIVDISVEGTMVGAEGCVAIQAALHHNTTLRRLRIRGGAPPYNTDEYVPLGRAIGAALPFNATLEELGLERLLKEEDADALLTGVSRNTGLRVLELRDCELKSASLAAPFRTILEKGGLRRLLLGDNELHEKVQRAIPQALTQRSQMVELDLSGVLDKEFHNYGYCHASLLHIVRALRDGALGRSLEVLRLRGLETKVSPADNDDSFEALARVLGSNATLRILDLSDVELDGNEIEALGGMIKANKALRELIVAGNLGGLRDDIAHELAKGLLHNSTLEILDVSNNQVSCEGLQSLAAALGPQSGLRHLRLGRKTVTSSTSGNKIGRRAAEAFARALDSGAPLVTLDCGGMTTLEHGHCEVLLRAMFRSKPVRTCTLRATHIAGGAKAMIDLALWYRQRRLARREGESTAILDIVEDTPPDYGCE
ncbi:unnamed protein product [Pedinophyceae sp. YPF-701]|nr:unnamed protein product [Pedinophyceae sp. YPF-701]